jgi:hypothetical protein
MNYTDYGERNYGEKCVKYRVELQQYEACSAVKGLKTKTQNKTISGHDYDAIGNVETHITINGM